MSFKYENLQYGGFKSCGEYDIPIIEPVYIGECPEMIGFNYAKTATNSSGKGVHFFLDDYQFSRLWLRPSNYLNLLQSFELVFSPDFSLYTDFPKAMQIYNHYRKHFLAAYWQKNGITVVPTISWSDEESFDWCFDGEPRCGTVAISSVGTQRNKESKRLFLNGYDEMLKRLQPETVIFYGKIPNECRGNIIRIRAFQEKWRETRTDVFMC